MTDDIRYMKLALEEARKCKSEPGRISPKVGAVVVQPNGEVTTAYRGEIGEGDHAEYVALELKLGDTLLAGSTLYTTLEPCTHRNPPKIPCVERVIDRKISKVWIGMLDPNKNISGRGQRRLREANIHVQSFPTDIGSQIEELNRDFTRDQKAGGSLPLFGDADIVNLRERKLDAIYVDINRTYWNQNYNRDASAIALHLTEVIGGVSPLASSKQKDGIDPKIHLAKAFAWWLALCGKLGVKSVEQMVWDKFPGICSYCHKVPHDPNVCDERKSQRSGPDWEHLATVGAKGTKPGRLAEWQKMFSKIYPAQQTEDYGLSFARLAEEMGELAEAVRVFRSEPGYVLSEAADVFAWLMHIQNIVDTKAGARLDQRGSQLELAVAESYPKGCTECGKRVCTCPPILSSTIGRIAHEVPANRGSYGDEGRFMSPDVASNLFREG